MLERILEENPKLRYPILAKSKVERMQRQPFTLEVEKVPKSQIRDRVRMEKEAMEALYFQCKTVAEAYNIQVGDGSIFNKNSEITVEKLRQKLRDTFCVSNNIKINEEYFQAFLDQNDLWQEYVRYVKIHPIDGYRYVRQLFDEMTQLQREIERQYAGIEKGEHGEELVAEYLRLFEGKYIIKNNVLLNSRTSSRAETSEADFCVITHKGIFVCEVKNIGNAQKTIRIAKDGRWEIVHNYTGQSEIKTQSPAAQNAIHCREIECFLEEHGFHDIPVVPIIIIANNAVGIDNQGMNYVIRKEELYNVLRCDPSPNCLDSEQMQTISKLIDNEHVEERCFDVETVSSIVDRIFITLKIYLRDYGKEVRWNSDISTYIYQCMLPQVTEFVEKTKEVIAEQERVTAVYNNLGRRTNNVMVVLVLAVVGMFILRWILTNELIALLYCIHTCVAIWTVINMFAKYLSFNITSLLQKIFLPGIILCFVIGISWATNILELPFQQADAKLMGVQIVYWIFNIIGFFGMALP